MAVNAASSSYVNSASSNKGFSGLASGVDTESMVEQLLSGTQSKIDKQEAMKKQLEWKQEIYRDIISQINSFHDKFFSYSSTSNLMSESFFSAMSAITSSSAFKATATSSATAGTSTMEVRRLATKASLTSGGAVSGKLVGKLDAAALKELTEAQLGKDEDYTVKFKVGDKNVSVNLRDLFVDGNRFKGYPSSTARDAAIQGKLEEAFKDTGVKVSVKDGSLSLTTEGADRPVISVAAGSGALGLQRLGLTASSRSTTKNGTQTSVMVGKVDDTPKMSFTVTLDDLTKTVSVDLRKVMNADGSVDTNKLKTQLGEALNKAHGFGQIKVADTADGGFELVVSDGRKLAVGGSAEVMDALGLKNGQSNRISLGSKLSELSFAKGLQGDSFRFSINGQEFHFDGDTALIDVMDVINRSGAGVRMIYRAQDDSFVLEATESGSGKQIQLAQEEGNLLSVIFGSGTQDNVLKPGSKVTTKKLTYTAADLSEKENVTGKSTLKSLDVKLYDKDGNLIDEETTLEELAEKSGGRYSYADGKITCHADEKTTLKDLGLKLYDKSGNLIDEGTTLEDLAKVSDGLYSYAEGRVTINGPFTPAEDDIKAALKDVFGAEAITDTPSGENAVFVDGQNALVKVDGMITERSSNNFSINGINYDLTGLSGSYVPAAGKIFDSAGNVVTGLTEGQYIENGTLYNADGSVAGSGYTYAEDGVAANATTASGILVGKDGSVQKFDGKADTITVSQDTDKMMDGIKEFVDEYNKLVKTLNDYLDEDASYRDYQPLTAAQKKEMSEREIELWEEKAKEGLLRRDSTIETFLQQMRTALYQKPSSGGYALYELGIETGAWETKGQLTFTTDGEAKLRQMLETDPSGVMKLFTDKEEGLAVKLNDIINKTAKVSSGSPGTLVQIAGVKGAATDKDNSIYDQIKAIDDKIAALKRTYEAEKTRYWKQFNTMEQLISQMNSQSSYLAQMMGS